MFEAWSEAGVLALECAWLGPVDPVQGAFDRVNRAEFRQRLAEAAKIEALLDAYDLAVADLVDRYGRSAGGRSGPAARSFLKQVAAELSMTEGAVGHLLDTATELRDSMPATWRLFTGGWAPWRSVDIALGQSQGVPADRMGEYDDLAAHAVEHTHAARLKDRLRRARERMLAESATTRRKLADANRRVRLEPMADGQAAIEIVGGATDWVPVDHALTAAAVAAKGTPGETRSVGQLRHDILLDIVTEGLKTGSLPDPATKVGQRKGVAVELLLTIPVLSLLGTDTALASIEGYGPIDLDKARELAAEAPSFVRVLTHPITGARLTMDRTAYRPPADLKRWLRIRDQECRDPGCRRPARHTDRDHVREWQHDGPTDAVNLASICRAMHLLKSMGLWQETVHPDDTVTWTSPWARTLTDPPPDPAPPAPRHLLEQDGDDCPF